MNNHMDGNIASLRFCANDAEVLQKAGYSVVTLHSEDNRPTHQPTRNNIEEELARMCQTAGRDDLLLVYFSGHGILIDGQPYLLPPEARRLSAARQALSLAVEVSRRAIASPAPGDTCSAFNGNSGSPAARRAGRRPACRATRAGRMAQMRDEGLPAPKAVLFPGLSNGRLTIMQALNEEPACIYHT